MKKLNKRNLGDKVTKTIKTYEIFGNIKHHHKNKNVKVISA